MRLDDQRPSENVEDERGSRGGGGGGGLGGLTLRGGSLGVTGIIIIVLVALFSGVNPNQILSQLSGGGPAQTAPAQVGAPSDQVGDFVARVLGSTEDVWTKLFEQNAMATYGAAGMAYTKPRLVLFTDSVATGCGGATAAVGPFYCPADAKVYLDVSFFDQLATRFGAPGDFAQAYVVAHEIGHHIQRLVGISAKAEQARQTMSAKDFNKFQVMMELQADCFAGVWGHYAQEWKNQLSPGDVDQALAAATSIGDDTLQKQARGYAVPDSFTHGSSEQRVRWFKTGFDGGDAAKCDTFRAPNL